MQLQNRFRRRYNDSVRSQIQNMFLVENLPKFIICSTLMALLTLLFSLLIRSLRHLFFLPLSQLSNNTVSCLGSTGDTSIESDRDQGVCLPAVIPSLLLVQALLCLSYLPQAVIQNPFSNGGSPAGEAVGGETRFAYFPATAVSDGTVSVQAASDPTLTQAGGESVHLLNLS